MSKLVSFCVLMLAVGCLMMTSCTKEDPIIDNTLKTTDDEFYSDDELDERNTQVIKIKDNVSRLDLNIQGKERLRFTNRFVRKGGSANLRNLVTSKNLPYPRDVIDLRAIDANTNTAKDDAFVISNNGLTGKAGQLAITIRSGVGHSSFPSMNIEGDVNGNGKADFKIRVNDFGFVQNLLQDNPKIKL